MSSPICVHDNIQRFAGQTSFIRLFKTKTKTYKKINMFSSNPSANDLNQFNANGENATNKFPTTGLKSLLHNSELLELLLKPLSSTSSPSSSSSSSSAVELTSAKKDDVEASENNNRNNNHNNTTHSTSKTSSLVSSLISNPLELSKEASAVATNTANSELKSSSLLFDWDNYEDFFECKHCASYIYITYTK